MPYFPASRDAPVELPRLSRERHLRLIARSRAIFRFIAEEPFFSRREVLDFLPDRADVRLALRVELLDARFVRRLVLPDRRFEGLALPLARVERSSVRMAGVC